MTGARLAPVCAMVATAVACGGGRATGSAAAHSVPMRPTPSAALALCRRSTLLRPACPRRVPIGPYAQARRPPGYTGLAAAGSIGFCSDGRTRRVPISSPACAEPSWILEAGAPAGLPPGAPPGIPGKRLPAARRTRPPQYVHIVLYAAHSSLAPRLSFPWPRGPAERTRDTLLRANRTKPILLGPRDWSGDRGTLVLAPRLIFGGENGDHLIFRWRRAGIEHIVSMHSWAPLREAEATLKAIIASAG
jgi:hypothetical protein